jgi:WD40 repeat protein
MSVMMRTLIGLFAVCLLFGAGMWSAPPERGQTEPSGNAPKSDGAKKANESKRDFYGDPLLPEEAIARLGCLRMRHDDEKECVYLNFLDEGKTIISVGLDSKIRFWETETTKLLREVTLKAVPFCVDLTRDGKCLACADDLTIRLVDVKTGEVTRTFKELPAEVRCLRFSPAGDFLYSAGDDKAVRVWKVKTGEEVCVLREHAHAVSALAVSADGKWLAAGDDSRDPADSEKEEDRRTILVWELATRKVTAKMSGFGTEVSALAFSPDGKQLVVKSTGQARFWDWKTQTQLRKLKRCGQGPITFSRDGRRLVTTSGDQSVELWDLEDEKASRTISLQVNSLRGALAFSPTGKCFVCSGSDGRIHLYDVEGKDLRPPEFGHRGAVRRLLFSADGKKLVTCGADKTVRVWDLKTGRQERLFTLENGEVNSRSPYDWEKEGLALSPGNKLLAVSDRVEREVETRQTLVPCVKIWDLGSGKLVQTVVDPQSTGYVHAAWPVMIPLKFLPDGVTLMTRGVRVSFWDAKTGNERRPFELEAKGLITAATSPDGRVLAVSQYRGLDPDRTDPAIHLWDLRTGKLTGKLTGVKELVAQLSLSPDGRTLAAVVDGPSPGSAEWPQRGKLPGRETIRIWDLPSGTERLQLRSPERADPEVRAFAFSPDGKLLASAERDGKVIRLWELANGGQVTWMSGHHGPIEDVAFAPDGKTLASASGDGTVLVWDVFYHPAALSPPPESDRKAWEVLWAELANEDQSYAFVAVRVLIKSPKAATALLADRLKPEPARDPRRISRLIASLDDKDFDVREQAQKELERLGPVAEPDLREAAKKPASPEAGKRLETILTDLAASKLDQQQLRQVRAVHVLELIASAEARQLLETLSKGEPLALQTREAQNALRRLSALEKKPPPGNGK